MNTELIFCPACNHKLRVPADLMGQRVECPKCGKEFYTPPPPAANGSDERYSAERPSRRRDAPPEDADWPQSRDVDWTDPLARTPQRAGRGMIVAPAIAIMIVAVLQILNNAYSLAITIRDPAMVRQQMQQIQGLFPGAAPMPFDPVQLNKIVATFFLLLSFLQFVGGVCMVRTRAYPMARIQYRRRLRSRIIISFALFGLGLTALFAAATMYMRARSPANRPSLFPFIMDRRPSATCCWLAARH